MRRSRRSAFAFVLLATVAQVGIVQADEGGQAGASSVSIELLTDFPIHIGAGVQVSAPHRLEFFTSLGVMPRGYLDTINAISESIGWYDELTSELIAASLENALVWRVGVGWRPLQERGWYVRGGYSFAALGGGLSGTEVIAAVTDSSPSSADDARSFAVDARVHLLDIETGWRVRLHESWTLRLGIGGSFTVLADCAVTPDWDVSRGRAIAVRELAASGENYLEDVFQKYVHTVTLTVATGWRF